jgi:hypothetical protein
MSENPVSLHNHNRKLAWIAFAILGFCVILLIICSLYSVDWSGFADKKFWDWMEVLLIPTILVLLPLVIDRLLKRSHERRVKFEREMIENQQQEEAMKSYMDLITLLILEKGLGAEGEVNE